MGHQNKMEIKYAKNNGEALKQLKDMKKGDILVFDERPEIKLCDCPVCRALERINAMAFYNQQMGEIRNLFYRIMIEDKDERKK